MANKLNLTWEDVLKSEPPYAKRWGHIADFVSLVDAVGYRYFEWNGRVYELVSIEFSPSAKDTGITADEL